MMEKSKRKNGDSNLRRYWMFFVPFTLFMALMVKHPLRFGIGELRDDGIFYGIISLICIASAIRIYRRARKQAHRLIAVILLCAVFAGWQPFDIFVLRFSTTTVASDRFDYKSNSVFSASTGSAYSDRRTSDNRRCYAIYEQYFGNNHFAITLWIEYEETRIYFCGS